MSRDKNRYWGLPDSTGIITPNSFWTDVLRHMRGNYISALDTLPDTILIRILTCYLCTSPKLPQSVAMPVGNPHFFVYPPKRGEIGHSLQRWTHFHLRTLQTGGSLSNDVLLHHCIQTVVQATRWTKVFFIFAIQKAVLRHNERLANERLLPVLVIVSNAIQVWEI